MNIKTLQLYDFRNYANLSATLAPGVNLLVGENAQGKTNLLEAVYYLSCGKSFRTSKPQELISFGKEFSDLSALLDTGERDLSVRAVIFSSRRPRQLFIGGVRQKTAAGLADALHTVLFCPEELQILKGSAAGRRKLLDNAICQLRPTYAQALAEYNRLLEQKLRILKDRFEMPVLLKTLPDYNERMAQVGAVLIEYRAWYLEKLGALAAAYHRDFSGGRETLSLCYETVSTVENPGSSRRELVEQLIAHQLSHERAELESAQCLSGPHKDDFVASINDVSVKSYGSQGQTRTAAISLKLAEREILRQDTGHEPVLLLDDVLSELDEQRQDFVLNQIRSGQVLITCCETGRLTSLGKTMLVRQGKLTEV